MPNRILVDQGSYFVESFAKLARIDIVELQRTGIEAHSSLDTG